MIGTTYTGLITVQTNNSNETQMSATMESNGTASDGTTSNGTISGGTRATTTQEPMTNIYVNTSTSKCEMTTTVLGFMVGLLMMALAIVMTGWGWTCWLLKRKAKRNTKLHSQER